MLNKPKFSGVRYWAPTDELQVSIVDCLQAEAMCLNQSMEPDKIEIISIWDSGTFAREKYPWLNDVNAEVFEFDDCERDLELHGYKAATMEDIEFIAHMGYRSPCNRVLIHCAAGQSRSSAAALVYFLGKGQNFMTALDSLFKAVELTFENGWRDSLYIRPNRRIIELADELFELNGMLTDLWECHFGNRAMKPLLNKDY